MCDSLARVCEWAVSYIESGLLLRIVQDPMRDTRTLPYTVAYL